MPTNNLTSRLVLCLLLLSPDVFAGPTAALPRAPSPDTHAKTPVEASPSASFTPAEAGRALNLGQLEAIQADTVLYEAELARVKALNALQKSGDERYQAQPLSPAPPALDTKPDVKGAAQNAIPPQIVEITGTGTGYLAVLSLSNGNRVTAQTGHRIPGTDYVIKRITLNEVVVSGNNQPLMSLSFAE
jgi:type IV pilus biogenesis protein PilP